MSKIIPNEIESTLRKIPLLAEEMNNKQLERREEINMMILTLFAKKHIFFLGAPGVGKTDILNIFSSCIQEGKIYETCIKDDTAYEELFGEYYRDTNGKKIYDFDGTIITSHFAILDEIWKGNSKTMNSLLSITSGNRVAFVQGYGKIHSPLLMVGAASNEMPQDESLDALSDRFVVKMRVNRIKDDKNWLRFIRGEYDKNPIVNTKFTADEIEFFYSYTMNNTFFTDDALALYLKIKKEGLKIELSMSDRRLGYSKDLLLTSAALNSRKNVNYYDFYGYSQCLN